MKNSFNCNTDIKFLVTFKIFLVEIEHWMYVLCDMEFRIVNFDCHSYIEETSNRHRLHSFNWVSKKMTTLPPIQPHSILCKSFVTNTSPLSSLVFLIHASDQPSTTVADTNFYPLNSNQCRQKVSIDFDSEQYFVLSQRLLVKLSIYNQQLWSTITNNFGIDSSCLNGIQALKNIHIR